MNLGRSGGEGRATVIANSCRSPPSRIVARPPAGRRADGFDANWIDPSLGQQLSELGGQRVASGDRTAQIIRGQAEQIRWLPITIAMQIRREHARNFQCRALGVCAVATHQ